MTQREKTADELNRELRRTNRGWAITYAFGFVLFVIGTVLTIYGIYRLVKLLSPSTP